MKALSLLVGTAVAASTLAIVGCSSNRSQPESEVATAPMTVPAEAPAEPVADANAMPSHPALPAEQPPQVAVAEPTPEAAPAPVEVAKAPEPVSVAPATETYEREPRADRN